MEEQPRSNKVSPEIYVYATNKNFLNVYDALRIDKVKLEVAGYDQTTGKQTGIASAWIDVDDLRLLAHLIISRQFKDVLDRSRFEKFGGSDRDGAVESRTLVFEWDTADGKFARYPYRITIANGPGLRTPNGAVQPKGEPASKLSMRLPEPDLMKIMLAVVDYLHAYEAAHHHRIVAEKVREVQEKLAGRAERRPPLAAAPEEEDRVPAAARPAAPPLRVVPGTAPASSPARSAAPPARSFPAPRPTPPVVASTAARPGPGGPARLSNDVPAPPLPRPTRAG
ncbi:MAG TPA: hypothetical protein VKY74_28085 [Chloroflexia bacterium]|nr:hypothetical protein [Chloroflexia bacterium]